MYIGNQTPCSPLSREPVNGTTLKRVQKLLFISILVLILAVLSDNIIIQKCLSGETIIVVAVTQLTFDPFILNFGEAYSNKK